MKKLLSGPVFFLALILTSGSASAGGHYAVGVEAYKASNMVTEGSFYKMYNAFVYADKFTDNQGQKTSGRSRLEAFTQLHRFGFHIAHLDALGADLITDFAIPVSWQRIESGGWKSRAFGLGDLLFEPVLLSWHGERYDFLTTVTLFLPTGRYHQDEFSPGKNFWSILPSVGLVYYLDEKKSWTVSLLGRYEFNTENNGQRDGDSLMLEWAVGKNFGVFDLALAGASKVQVTDNSGSRANRDTRDRQHSIGPELVYFHEPSGLQFSLRSLWDYETANGPQGNMTTLSIVKAF
ncbi:MAG: transporter [Candidatus Adiutrix sp.]|jgi:hypothetical protein|nr:transporter [Candidatus Adiutrix sp.]